mmetsp:Transcript_16776/g.33529  ORF Transcript_16776/g.33529 Transcript_16776/m.33529 type:complete len:455 (-) Transcript_16776:559-1923(-)
MSDNHKEYEEEEREQPASKRRKTNVDETSPFGALGHDLLVKVVRFLDWKRALIFARVSKNFKEAAQRAKIPRGILRVSTCEIGERLGEIGEVFPAIEGVVVRDFPRVDRPTPLNLYLAKLGTFLNLKELDLSNWSSRFRLVGSYSALQPLHKLQSLNISNNGDFRFNLGVLSAFPYLKHFSARWCSLLMGDLKDLGHLCDHLETLELDRCESVTGSLGDMANFTALKILSLSYCRSVRGGIRAIKPGQFASLRQLDISETRIYGGQPIEAISDDAVLASAWHRLFTTLPSLEETDSWRGLHSADNLDDPYTSVWIGSLDDSSPEFYYSALFSSSAGDRIRPPLDLYLCRVGPRFGYRWGSSGGIGWPVTKMIWLDTEPRPGDIGYEKYRSGLEMLEVEDNESCTFTDLRKPPSEEEYLTRMHECGMQTRRSVLRLRLLRMPPLDDDFSFLEDGL